MVKSIVVASLLIIGNLTKAQDYQGKAEYFSKRILKNSSEMTGKPGDDAELKKAYEDALKQATEKMFTLTFNKREALFEKQQTLEKPKPKDASVTVTMTFSGEGKKYINIQDKVKITEDDIFGKEFLIVDSLTPYQWKLIDETKKIDNYTCNKAEAIIPVSDKQRKEYEEYLKEQENKTSLFPVDEPKEKKIIAWYAPEIPVSFGPANYWGLPGLILLLDDEDMMLFCCKIVLSNKDSGMIKVPNTGRKVTQEEFDAIHKDKLDNVYSR